MVSLLQSPMLPYLIYLSKIQLCLISFGGFYHCPSTWSPFLKYRETENVRAIWYSFICHWVSSHLPCGHHCPQEMIICPTLPYFLPASISFPLKLNHSLCSLGWTSQFHWAPQCYHSLQKYHLNGRLVVLKVLFFISKDTWDFSFWKDLDVYVSNFHLREKHASTVGNAISDSQKLPSPIFSST